MMKNATCRNCEQPLQSHYAYCPYCSQKSELHRLSMHEVIHEAIHYFTHADKGFFQLIRDLALKNGRVAKEYMDGKRKKYFPPLNFFLLAAAIYVFVATFGQHSPDTIASKDIPAGISQIKDAGERAKEIIFYTRRLEASWFLNKYSNILSLFVLPLTAFLFFIFYCRGKYNYTEHLVANMYLGGFMVLFCAIIITPVTTLLGLPGWAFAIVYFLCELIYFTIFYCRFLAKYTFGQGVKVFFVSLVAILGWLIISMTGFGLYVKTGFWGIFGHH